MGWTTPNHNNKALAIRENASELRHALGDRLLGYALSANAQWALVRHKEDNDCVYAIVHIYEGASYKCMDTSCGPYAHDVPRSWIDRITGGIGYTDDWKERARAYSGKRAKETPIECAW